MHIYTQTKSRYSHIHTTGEQHWQCPTSDKKSGRIGMAESKLNEICGHIPFALMVQLSQVKA